MSGQILQTGNSSTVKETAFFHDQIKALQSGTKSKALGTDPALAAWYEEAHAYWRDIASGKVEATQAEQQQLVEWMNWAYQQLIGQQSWDPMQQVVTALSASPQANTPEGAYLGADGNYIFDQNDSHTYYSGDSTRNDIWSFKNIYEVNSAGAKITYEITSDGLNPPSEVLKVITKAPGGEEVRLYYNWDHPEFELKIKAANVEGIVGSVDLGDKLKIEKWDNEVKCPEAMLNGQPFQGEEIEGEEDHFYYEAPDIASTLQFRPDGNVNFIEGNWELTLSLSDEAKISLSDQGGYDAKVTVTDKDGNETIYYVKEKYEGKIIAMEDQVVEFFAPNGWKNYIAVSSGATSDDLSETPINPDHPEDSIPDEIEGDLAYFKTQDNISLHTNHDSDIYSINITTPGEVEIYAGDYNDEVNIYKTGEDSYTIQVINDEGHNVFYNIEGPPSRVTIRGALPQNVYFTSSDQNYRDMDPEDIPEWAEGIIVDEEGSISPEISEDEIEIGETEEEEIEWPSAQFIASVPTEGNSTDMALQLAMKINQALKDKSWSEVFDYIYSLESKHANNVIRKIITGIFLAAGSSQEQLDTLLDQIPTHIRRAMMDKVLEKSNEWTEIQEGDQWNSSVTAAMIEESIDVQEGAA